MTICKKCGSENTDNAKFCLECGANLVEQRKESEITKCIKCGAELPKKAKFCSECGASQIEVVEEKESIQISEPAIEEVYNPASTQTGSSEQLESDNTENDIKKLCSSCGAEVSPDDKFCPGCGMKLEDEKNAITSSKCISCGAEITQNIKFCPKCGANQNIEVVISNSNSSENANQKTNKEIKEANKVINNTNVAIPTNKKELKDAMFEAIKNNDVNTVEAILNSGFKPNKRLTSDFIPLLGIAAIFDSVDVAKVLIQHRAKVKGMASNTGYNSYTPLMLAVVNNSLETAQLLLDSGADPNATNQNCHTALKIAQSYNFTDMSNLLVKYGAKRNSVRSVLYFFTMILSIFIGRGWRFGAACVKYDSLYLRENVF